MIVPAIHATGRHVLSLISAEGFRPGRGLADYLGEGAYFYLVSGDDGLDNAVFNAKKIAQRNNPNVACLLAHIDVSHALNLQHPQIHRRFQEFADAFERRLERIGLLMEANDDWSYRRPTSHLKIEAFRRFLEAIVGAPYDVLAARFSIKRADLDEELPHELCVKRARAIQSFSELALGSKSSLTASDPSTWHCPKATVDAAERCVEQVARIADRDLTDLIVSIYQGSDSYWRGPSPRFGHSDTVSLLFDSSQHDLGEMVEECLRTVAKGRRQVRVCDLAQLSDQPVARAQRDLHNLVTATGGVIAVLTPADFRLVSVVTRLCERRPEVPILALLADRAGGRMHDFPLPPDMRSRHNLCCVGLSRGGLEQHLLGYLNDRWTDGLSVLEIGSHMAARHGSAEIRAADARRIVEAYHARRGTLL